jgi:hypothetical protein
MAEEFSRTTARKKVKMPNGNTVNIPVVTKISFIDAAERYQETQYSIDNSAQGQRTIHVDDITPSAEVTGDPLKVERVDTWRVGDAPDRAQETFLSFDNVTGGDTKPPRFTTHLKTHVVRYKNDPDDGNWIDSELIDQFIVLDAVDRGQETVCSLNWPPGTFDNDGKEIVIASLDDPDISDTDNGIDPPWRTDPFQNIIDCNGVGVFIFSNGLAVWGDETLTPFTCSPATAEVSDNEAYQINIKFSGGTFPTSHDANGVPISPSSFSVPSQISCAAWTVAPFGATAEVDSLGYPVIELFGGTALTLPPQYAYLGSGWTQPTFTYTVTHPSSGGSTFCNLAGHLSTHFDSTQSHSGSVTVNSTFTYLSVAYVVLAIKVATPPVFGVHQGIQVLFVPETTT